METSGFIDHQLKALGGLLPLMALGGWPEEAHFPLQFSSMCIHMLHLVQIPV